ncbi:hypothetical protein [Methylobacterium sp. Leaf118]|uniref:hypothetical protein n=1 Tax=Methylobacterium sp. Leaf118 TaxID=2876562 RepID=UPI001E5E1A93|nr:hypothetical protein [Methylobacterium sp. Leaf118]
MKRPSLRLASLAAFLAASALASPARSSDHGVDTEHLFGFTEGSDLGAPPEKELESETTARLGKRGGSFRAVDSALVLKLPLSDRFRVAPGLAFAGYAMRDVPGLDDRSVAALAGGFVETRARLLTREEAPFGLTLNTVIGGSRLDAATGLGARGVSVEAGLLMDREIVPGEVVGAVNVVYALGRSRLDGGNSDQRASNVEVSGAVARRFGPGLFLGLEARYLRAYHGLGLDRFAGQAVYLGPTVYKELTEATWISVTWGTQVSGSEARRGEDRDLTNFDRHQVRLRIGTHF